MRFIFAADATAEKIVKAKNSRSKVRNIHIHVTHPSGSFLVLQLCHTSAVVERVPCKDVYRTHAWVGGQYVHELALY